MPVAPVKYHKEEVIMKQIISVTARTLIVLLSLTSLSAVASDHALISTRPLYVADGNTGVWYSGLPGHAVVGWKDATRYGYFYASASSSVAGVYEFTLTAISNQAADRIEGLWDIAHNGLPVCTGCVGRAYGIDSPPGSYFKIYIGDSLHYAEKWHFSGYITSRADF
jgi:hypothetical protein